MLQVCFISVEIQAVLRFLVIIRNLRKFPWDIKKIFQKTFCSMQNFLKCLINDVVGFLEWSMFTNASLPNIRTYYSMAINRSWLPSIAWNVVMVILLPIVQMPIGELFSFSYFSAFKRPCLLKRTWHVVCLLPITVLKK